MKRIYSAANLMEAHIILDLLRHAGINARLFNENAQGAVGEIPFANAYPDIWVINDDDALRGKAVVIQYEHAPIDTGIVVCNACGEENPRNFQLCWHCGAGLEDMIAQT
ncbi:MAG: DUF2007 domain-containing protein [Gallionellaceae bacterium]|jgi:hypothetical protein